MIAANGTLAVGTRVRIKGLVKSKEFNGKEGSIVAYSAEKNRYAISIGGEQKMFQPGNVEMLGPSSKQPVFANIEDMMANLEKMGLDPSIFANITPEQKQKMFEMTKAQSILDRAVATHRAANAEVGTMNPAAGGLYSWRDEKEKAYVELKCEAGAKCDIAKDRIKISAVGGDEMLSGKLFQDVDVEKCEWEMKDDGNGNKLMAISLFKRHPMRYAHFLHQKAFLTSKSMYD
jgi:hypothetical protein